MFLRPLLVLEPAVQPSSCTALARILLGGCFLLSLLIVTTYSTVAPSSGTAHLATASSPSVVAFTSNLTEIGHAHPSVRILFLRDYLQVRQTQRACPRSG